MPEALKFHLTQHFRLRMEQRGVRLEHAKNVVKYAQHTKPLGRGTHGGIRRKYSKTDSGRTIVVVAETKANDCWLVTAYYAT
jgi:hypothetical protein